MIVRDQYRSGDALLDLSNVMADSLELINAGMWCAGVWLLQTYGSDVDFETFQEQQDHPESDAYNNGVGPLGH